MRNKDYYRCLGTDALLMVAREDGIDPEMAVVLAERLEVLDNQAWRYGIEHKSMGGRYMFKERTDA